MSVTSLDKPKDFPPPIKIITQYENTPPARVLGCRFLTLILKLLTEYCLLVSKRRVLLLVPLMKIDALF
jgi:hypothetical protein